MNAARETQGRAHLFYRLRKGIKESVDFRQPIKRGRPWKHPPCRLSPEDEVT